MNRAWQQAMPKVLKPDNQIIYYLNHQILKAMTKQEAEKHLKNDYALIPLKDIDDVARMIAVKWGGESGMDWIGDKHKLASDIMNYAKHFAEQESIAFAEWKEANTFKVLADTYRFYDREGHFTIKQLYQESKTK